MPLASLTARDGRLMREDSDMPLDSIDAVDVGARLRGAREAAGLTQTDAAADLRVARTTLVAMEQGRRRVRTDELQHLARLYGTSVNAVLRREAVHVDLVPRFRELSTANDESAERAERLLTDLVRAEVELENLLGVTRTRNYPPARPLLGESAAPDSRDAGRPVPYLRTARRQGSPAGAAERRAARAVAAPRSRRVARGAGRRGRRRKRYG